MLFVIRRIELCSFYNNCFSEFKEDIMWIFGFFKYLYFLLIELDCGYECC